MSVEDAVQSIAFDYLTTEHPNCQAWMESGLEGVRQENYYSDVSTRIADIILLDGLYYESSDFALAVECKGAAKYMRAVGQALSYKQYGFKSAIALHNPNQVLIDTVMDSDIDALYNVTDDGDIEVIKGEI